MLKSDSPLAVERTDQFEQFPFSYVIMLESVLARGAAQRRSYRSTHPLHHYICDGAYLTDLVTYSYCFLSYARGVCLIAFICTRVCPRF